LQISTLRPLGIAIILVSTVGALPLNAECAPKSLLKMITQDGTPGLPPSSFAAQPKIVYRLGVRYARVEEQLDSEHNIHGLVVVNTPDSWMVNRVDNTGKHIIDPDPKGKVVLPLIPAVIGGEPVPPALTSIELGCEVEFFRSHGSPITPLQTASGPRSKQAFGVDGWNLVLIRGDKQSQPEMLFLFRQNDIVFALRYLTYEEHTPADLRLFARPEGVVFTNEARP
jgi:hypothetical protein